MMCSVQIKVHRDSRETILTVYMKSFRLRHGWLVASVIGCLPLSGYASLMPYLAKLVRMETKLIAF